MACSVFLLIKYTSYTWLCVKYIGFNGEYLHVFNQSWEKAIRICLALSTLFLYSKYFE